MQITAFACFNFTSLSVTLPSQISIVSFLSREDNNSVVNGAPLSLYLSSTSLSTSTQSICSTSGIAFKYNNKPSSPHPQSTICEKNLKMQS